jgi:hypothetical protein
VTTPSSDQIHYKPLDPLGAVVYYSCVTGALESGGLILPSTATIADSLRIFRPLDQLVRAHDDRVQRLWNDLVWMNDHNILFNEQPRPKSEFFLSLSQHNVNRRIQRFPPGFDPFGKRARRLNENLVVEKTITAARLVALKDLYHFRKADIPHQLFTNFATAQQLIADAQESFHFLNSMLDINYVSVSPLPSPSFDPTITYYLSPSEMFRCLDMYVELRTLDFFADNGATDDERHQQRIRLQRMAQTFTDTSQHPSIPKT